MDHQPIAATQRAAGPTAEPSPRDDLYMKLKLLILSRDTGKRVAAADRLVAPQCHVLTRAIKKGRIGLQPESQHLLGQVVQASDGGGDAYVIGPWQSNG